jgi:hypothetical protein
MESQTLAPNFQSDDALSRRLFQPDGGRRPLAALENSAARRRHERPPPESEAPEAVVAATEGEANTTQAPSTTEPEAAQAERAGTHDRAWWKHQASRAGSDWHGLVPLWWVASLACPHCGKTPDDDPLPSKPTVQTAPPRRSRPTPQTTIEAILYCCRERGAKALSEPENRRRLRDCDTAAIKQINERLAKREAVSC